MKKAINRVLSTVTAGLSIMWYTSQSHAEDRLAKMIGPSFHQVNFEDPRSYSEAKFLYVHHEIDDSFITGGGNVNVYALQLRYAISEDLAIIATKDGIVDFNPTVGADKNGLADIEAGLKYSFYRDNQGGNIVTGALRYLAPTGEKDVFQGQGDGFIHPSLSAATALSDNISLMSGTGLRIPVNDKDSMMWDLDAQIDYRIDTECSGTWYPFLGSSLIMTANEGSRLPLTSEGQDFFNFGSSNSGGRAMVIAAAGFKVRPVSNIDLGVAYQVPYDNTKGSQILSSRWTGEISFRF